MPILLVENVGDIIGIICHWIKTSDSKNTLLLVLFAGELSIMYIFTRYQFNWDEVKYSIYSTYSLVTHSIGKLIITDSKEFFVLLAFVL